jgi:hypothetical protein
MKNKMKREKPLFLLVLLMVSLSALGQSRQVVPDLPKLATGEHSVVHNRSATYKDGEIHLDAKPGDGLLLLKDFLFANGKIEVDIKGRNQQGQSFVGLAFHGSDEKVYDAIYFRPFNFKNADRKNNSVQYIAHPGFTWNKLREQNPGKYENAVTPVPDPDEWFHVTIVIAHPLVEVFVNDSATPSLSVTQLSDRRAGSLGFWVGNNSEGSFRNLKIDLR